MPEYTTLTLKQDVKDKLEEWAEEHCSRKDTLSDVVKKLIEKAQEGG